MRVWCWEWDEGLLLAYFLTYICRICILDTMGNNGWMDWWEIGSVEHMFRKSVYNSYTRIIIRNSYSGFKTYGLGWM